MTLGVRAVERLEQQTGLRPAELPVGGVCRLVADPPRRCPAVSERRAGPARGFPGGRPRARRAAGPFVGGAVGINWGCSGYAKAMEVAARSARHARPRRDQFILVVTANRTTKSQTTAARRPRRSSATSRRPRCSAPPTAAGTPSNWPWSTPARATAGRRRLFRLPVPKMSWCPRPTAAGPSSRGGWSSR